MTCVELHIVLECFPTTDRSKDAAVYERRRVPSKLEQAISFCALEMEQIPHPVDTVSFLRLILPALVSQYNLAADNIVASHIVWDIL